MVPLRPVVMGVSGAGRSALASPLAGRFGIPSVEGDDIHPPADVAETRSGLLLVDADRWPWPDRVAGTLQSSNGVVLACSALKRADRARIRAEASPDLRFVFLAAATTDRPGERSGHDTAEEIGRRFAARSAMGARQHD